MQHPKSSTLIFIGEHLGAFVVDFDRMAALDPISWAAEIQRSIPAENSPKLVFEFSDTSNTWHSRVPILNSLPAALALAYLNDVLVCAVSSSELSHDEVSSQLYAMNAEGHRIAFEGPWTTPALVDFARRHLIDTVRLADRIAEHAHRGQFRRDGSTPYIVHPRAVASRVNDDDAKATAYLHDVLEDTAVTASDLLSAGIPAHIVDAVQLLTKREGQSYNEYITGVAANDLAKRVKIADMLSNLSDSPTDKQIIKYAKALLFLMGEGAA